ncbi:endonuclease/exonuclease/phosphatase family protein [Aquamicrobium terrae]|uniref:Endonuclease/exonuclease/phosphatase (EEP) superfamily protein YafD n=1 Tax=Aquamicrobium terrae TaxID=1324945 RepID=A0ABV2MVA3_9HYPH
MTRSIRPLLLPCMIAASLGLMLGFFGSLHPAFDSFAHFRVHLAAVTAVLALVLLFSPYRVLALSALVFATSAFSSTTAAMRLPFGMAATAFPIKPADQAVYRLMELNLRYDNAAPEKVLSLIGRVQPDVVTLSEVSEMWEEKLNLLQSAYPNRIMCESRDPRFGVAVLSRRPFADGGEPSCHRLLSLTVTSVDFGGVAVDIGSLHLGWPWPFPQAEQIADLRQPLSTLRDNAILAGDLNSTPWSAAAHDIAEAGGFAIVPSPGPTWIDRRLPHALLFAGLPIDNVFAKGDITVHSIERLEPVGSDHMPLLVEFSLRPQPEEPEDERETATVSREQLRG